METIDANLGRHLQTFDGFALAILDSEHCQFLMQFALYAPDMRAGSIRRDGTRRRPSVRGGARRNFEIGAVLDEPSRLTARSAAEKGLALAVEAAPELSGRRLRGDAPKIHALPGRERSPILAMTARVAAEDKTRYYAVGMKDFVAQPIDPETLFATVLRWLPLR